MIDTQKLIYSVHIEILDTVYNYKNSFPNEIKEFITKANQFYNTKLPTKENHKNLDWQKISQDKDKLICSIFDFVSTSKAYKQVIPQEALHASALYQYVTILVIINFFTEDALKCFQMNKDCTNLSSLQSYAHFIESFLSLEHFSYMCATYYPITFLNLVLTNHPNLDKACEYYVKSNQSDSQCSSELSLLIAKIKFKFLSVEEE